MACWAARRPARSSFARWLPARPSAPRLPALVAAAACSLATGVTFALPKPVAFETILKTYQNGEDTILAQYNDMIHRLSAGKIGMREVAHEIDHTTVPAWQTLAATIKLQRQDWERRQKPTPAQGGLLELLEQLMATREDGWTRMSAALGVQDADAFEQTSADTEVAVREILKQVEDLKSQ